MSDMIKLKADAERLKDNLEKIVNEINLYKDTSEALKELCAQIEVSAKELEKTCIYSVEFVQNAKDLLPKMQDFSEQLNLIDKSLQEELKTNSEMISKIDDTLEKIDDIESQGEKQIELSEEIVSSVKTNTDSSLKEIKINRYLGIIILIMCVLTFVYGFFR